MAKETKDLETVEKSTNKSTKKTTTIIEIVIAVCDTPFLYLSKYCNK